MKLRRAISPLISTLILMSIAIAGGLIIYSVLPGLIASLGGRLEVQIVSVNLIKSGDEAVFSITVQNIGNKPTDGIVVSGVDDNGKTFKLALPPADPGGETSNFLVIPLDISDLVLDASGNNNHGTIHGASWTMDPDIGVCLTFDGVDDYMEVPQSPSLNFNAMDEITFEFWVKMLSWDGVYWGLMTKENRPRLQFYVNRLHVRYFDEGNIYRPVNFPTSIPDYETDVWHLWCITVNQVTGGWSNYLDDDFVGTVNSPYRMGATAKPIKLPFDDAHYGNGIINEVRIYYSRSLTGEEVEFNSGSSYPITGNLALWLPLDEGTNDPYSFTKGNTYVLTIIAYSLDESIFSTTTNVKCE